MSNNQSAPAVSSNAPPASTEGLHTVKPTRGLRRTRATPAASAAPTAPAAPAAPAAPPPGMAPPSAPEALVTPPAQVTAPAAPAASAPSTLPAPPVEAAPAAQPRRGRLSVNEREWILAQAAEGRPFEEIAEEMGRQVKIVQAVIAAAQSGSAPVQTAPETPFAQQTEATPPAPRKAPRAAPKGCKGEVRRAQVLVALTKVSIHSGISFEEMQEALAIFDDAG